MKSIFIILFFLITTASFLALLKPKKYFFFFIILFTFIPTSTSLSVLNVFEGIFVYDGILISSFLIFFLNRGRAKITLEPHEILAIVIYITYLFTAIILSPEIKYAIKELRPLLLVGTAIFLNTNLKIRRIEFKNNTLILLSITLFFALILKVMLQNYIVSLNGDSFYRENTYRYLDASTYISTCIILYLLQPKKAIKFKKTALFLNFMVLLAGNSRFIFLSLFLILILNNLSYLKSVFRTFFFGSAAVLAFFLYSISTDSHRLLATFSFQGLSNQLMTRYSPALNKIKDFDVVELLFGEGLGRPFYIPWFTYRENLNPYNINIDSFYLTEACKFGLLSVPIILLFSKFHRLSFSRKKDEFSILILLIFFVSSTPYHIYAIGILFGYHITRVMNETCIKKAST